MILHRSVVQKPRRLQPPAPPAPRFHWWESADWFWCPQGESVSRNTAHPCSAILFSQYSPSVCSFYGSNFVTTLSWEQCFVCISPSPAPFSLGFKHGHKQTTRAHILILSFTHTREGGEYQHLSAPFLCLQSRSQYDIHHKEDEVAERNVTLLCHARCLLKCCDAFGET